MSQTLVFFEGIAGSGKSTTSQNINKRLDEQGLEHRLLREIDEDNPFVIVDVPEDGMSYRDIATKKWDDFLEKTISNHSVWLMDNAFLQYPINALVWIDYPRDKIVEHITSVYEKINSNDLKLVYFHGNSVREEVNRVLELRGQDWIDKNVKSFVVNPFGKKYKEQPIEGIHAFFEEVVSIYEKVLEELPIKILRMNKSSLDWARIENEILDFILSK